jgi:hypothetical protein
VAGKEEPPNRTRTTKSGTHDKKEVDRRKAQKALDASNALFVIAIAIYAIAYWLPNIFGLQPVTNPIALLASATYITLLLAIVTIDLKYSRSLTAVKRVVTGLALISIGFITFVAASSLPTAWRTPTLPLFLALEIAGFILLLTGWYKAHQTLRKITGQYTQHIPYQTILPPIPHFKPRNYHLILIAATLSASLLTITSMITTNPIYAAAGILFLIILTIIAGTVKTRANTKRL